LVDAMHARRDNPLVPAWRGDLLESATPPEIEAPYFDGDLKAWVLSRHADILAAFQDSSLCPADPKPEKVAEVSDESMRTQMRAETLEALGPAQLRAWREALLPELERLVRALPVGEPVDLLETYARPLCLSLAAIVTGISREAAEGLDGKARRVSAYAADPFDAALRPASKAADKELRGCFHSGPEILRDSTFVALSQTMVCMLGNAWFGLVEHPGEWGVLHEEPGLMEQAVEELLRYAGLVRILARVATVDLDLNGCHIRKGERIIMRIVAGNRDPERFVRPDEVDVRRRTAGNFALGSGPHSCVGASLIRMAAVTMSRPLVQNFSAAELVRPVEWKGGAGFRSPAALWVSLLR
jgi:cytochrome P450